MVKSNRQDTGKEVANLKQIIKKLKGRLRTLQKEVNRKDAELESFYAIFSEDEISEARKERREDLGKIELCPDCGNPTVDKLAVGVWEISKCSSCDWNDKTRRD